AGAVLIQFDAADSRLHVGRNVADADGIVKIVIIDDPKLTVLNIDSVNTDAVLTGSAILAVLAVLTVLTILAVLTILTRLALRALRSLRSHSALQDLSGVVAIGDHNLSICIDSKGL